MVTDSSNPRKPNLKMPAEKLGASVFFLKGSLFSVN
jgi:hypothetical protein